MNLFDILSNTTYVWCFNAFLSATIIALGISLQRKNARFESLEHAYICGYVAADAANTMRLFETRADHLLSIPDISAEKLNLLITIVWDQGASVDEVADILGIETDAVILELCRTKRIPGEVVDLQPTHPSGLTFEEWRDGITYRDKHPRLVLDEETESVFVNDTGDDVDQPIPFEVVGHTRTKDARTPLQLVRQDTAGYPGMD